MITALRKAVRKYRYIRSKIQYRYPGVFQFRKGPAGGISNMHLFDYSNPAYHNGLRETYSEYFIQCLDGEKRFAEEICEHRFTFLSHRHEHGKEIEWNLDPESKRTWDSGFSLDVIFRGPQRLGDIKLAWELNKHQYFFALGKLYLLTGITRYRDEIIDQIDSWIDRNPQYKGVNWISALEKGARVISWIMAYPFIKEFLTGVKLSKYLTSLILQLKFIEENLSYGKFPNTHLIGEASALVVGGLFLDARDSGRWISKGMTILASQIPELTFDDGVYREQSLNYQRFFLDYYYLILILLKKNGIGYPASVDAKIETMTEFLLYALKSDGAAPSFGDADDARGIYVKHNCIDDYRGILALGAVMFNRGDFKFVAGDVPEEVLWLTGSEGVERYRRLPSFPPSQTSKAYDKGGYYIMRNGWDRNANYLIFDCGPLGHGSGGHGHADALSIQLQIGGNDYLIDPGTYTYNLDYEWRNYFRSTRAHNTVTVDTFDQSELGDRMSWKSQARSTCNKWLTTDFFDFVDGEHDGYQRINHGVGHRRLVFYDRVERWIIIDVLRSDGRHTYDCHLHIHPRCTVNCDSSEGRLNITAADDKRVTVSFLDDLPGGSRMEIFQGDKETMLGWYSKNYGSKEHAKTVRVRRADRGDATFVTVVNGSPTDYNVAMDGLEPLKLRMHDAGDESEELLVYSMSCPRHVVLSDVRFKGSFCYVKKRAGEILCAYASDFQHFEISDRLVSSEKTIESLKILEGRIDVTISEAAGKDLQVAKKSFEELFVNGSVLGSPGNYRTFEVNG